MAFTKDQILAKAEQFPELHKFLSNESNWDAFRKFEGESGSLAQQGRANTIDDRRNRIFDAVASITRPDGTSLFQPGEYATYIGEGEYRVPSGQTVNAFIDASPFGNNFSLESSMSSLLSQTGPSQVAAEAEKLLALLDEYEKAIQKNTGPLGTLKLGANTGDAAPEFEDIYNQLFGSGGLLSEIRNLKEDVKKLAELKNELDRLYNEAQAALDEEKAAARKPKLFGNDEEKAALAAKQADLLSLQDNVAKAFTNAIKSNFREQCFIQRYTYDLITHRIIKLDKKAKLPYEEGDEAGFNRPLVIHGTPFGFMNKLVMPRSTSTLFTIPNYVLSQLQPHVRLYKLVTDSDGNERTVEIKFPANITKDVRDSGHSTLEDMLKNSKRRGHGAGLKRFNFSYEGSDPFSIKKSISAKLEIFAASFEELLIDRGGYSYADLALKTASNKKSETQNIQSDINSDGVIDNLDKLRFRLKAVVGYSSPKNLHVPTGYDGDEIRRAIYNSSVSLNLTPTIHEFKFDETGRINFSINYLAYIEDFFDASYFNVFSDPKTTSSVYRRKVLRKYYESKCMLEDIDDLKREEEVKIPQEQRASLRSLLEQVLTQGNVRNLHVKYGKLGDLSLNPLIRLDDIISYTRPKKSENNAKEEAESTQQPQEPQDQGLLSSLLPQPVPEDQITTKTEPQSVTAGTNSNVDEQISFVYFYDLVAIAMQNVEKSLSDNGYIKVLDKLLEDNKISSSFHQNEKQILLKMHENFKRFRVILGPIEIKDPENSGHYREASIADIPISIKYFAEWMTEKVVARDRVEYNISRFINDFVKNYIRNFLNDNTCYSGQFKQGVSFFSSNVTSYKRGKSEYDEITTYIKEDQKDFNNPDLKRLVLDTGAYERVSEKSILNVTQKRDLPSIANFVDEFNYMIFYAGRSKPAEYMTGDRLADEQAGIYHYVLGRDVGIVKTIDLRRTDAEGLKELRFEQEGYDGLQQLREVYDATIKTNALPSAYPGTYIFVDPRGFAPDTNRFTENKKNSKINNLNKFELSKYGVGGYFMIVKSDHVFQEGLAETQITAKWVAEISNKTSDDSSSKESGDSSDNVSRALMENSGTSSGCKSKKSSLKTSYSRNADGSPEAPVGGQDTVELNTQI